MSNVTLVYECDGGQQPTANFLAKVSAVAIDEGEVPSIWFGVSSDTTVAVANTNTVRRTIVYGVLAGCPFTTETEYKDFLRGIFTNKFALRVPARVTAAEPVVT